MNLVSGLLESSALSTIPRNLRREKGNGDIQGLETRGMTEFGKERMRSIAGLVCGLLTLWYVAQFGLVRDGWGLFDAWFSNATSTGWATGVIWGLTGLYYASGAIPVWMQQVKRRGRLSTLESWGAAFHPWSGLVATGFVLWHLGCYQWPAQAVEGSAFAWTSAYVSSSSLIVFVYTVGIAALALHLAWGAWRFGVSWGLATGEKAMSRLTVLSSLLFCWTVLTGFEALAVFLGGA